MPRVTKILRSAQKALEDLELLKVLQSEIKHELSSSTPFQSRVSASLGDFGVEWDSSQSQDVVLRRKCESGEEVSVSALLGPANFEEEGTFPRKVLMKVCVKKPSLSSVLQFDCEVSAKHDYRSEFDISNAYYLHSMSHPGRSAYRGPLFSTLDPRLQHALREYLVAKGISENLTNFLLLHLYRKEHGQYVDWLQKLESMVGKSSE